MTKRQRQSIIKAMARAKRRSDETPGQYAARKAIAQKAALLEGNK